MPAQPDPTPAASARHAQVVPSFFASWLREPLSCRLGTVQVSELFCWQRATELSEADRTILLRAILKRSRARASKLWTAPVAVRLEAGWREQVSTADRDRLERILAHIAPRAFESLTLRELKTFWGKPQEHVLALLARLEALYWVPETQRLVEPRLAAPRVPAGIEVTPHLRALAGDVLSLPWVSAVRGDDPRFWFPGTEGVKEWVEAEFRKPQAAPRVAQLLALLAQAEKLSALEEAQAIADAVVRERYRHQRDDETYARRTAMFLARYLSADGPGRTLEEAGKLFGVTRERIRQLCFLFEAAVADVSVAAPALERVLRTAARIVPSGIAEANEQLRPYLGEGLGIESALVWAQALGRRDLPVRVGRAIYRNRGQVSCARMLEAADGASPLREVLRLAYRDCAVFGCTNVIRLAGLLALEAGALLDAEALEAAVANASGFRWLDRENGWFTETRGNARFLQGAG